MKRLFAFILVSVALFLIVGCNKDNGPIQNGGKEEETVKYDVSKYEIVPNAPEKAEKNVKKLASLLKKAKKNATVFFPEGDYYLSSNSGCLNLYGLKNVTFEGENATLINASYDPTIKKSTASASKSVTIRLTSCQGITFKNLDLDYAAYTQVCGKVVSVDAKATTIEIDSRFTDGSSKIPLTGDEYIMAVNVIDEDGNTKGDFYAPDDGFAASLEGNLYTISGSFGSAGDTLVARFTLGTYAGPTIFVNSTKELKFENIRSYSSPTATFYAPLDNENFTFDSFCIAPPRGAEWLWGTNVDSIHIKGLRGKITLKNSTFKGLGDDALNVHSIAPKVTAADGSTVSLEYFYGGALDALWSRAGDEIEFYDKTYKLIATGKAKSAKSGKLTLENISGEIKAGCFARNKSTCPDLEIENVEVDGGRARAFLVQSKNATIRNCKISNLGLAAIIVSPDIDFWGEMGPSEQVEISGLEIRNVCSMKTDACRGAIMVTNSHSGSVKGSGTLHGTVKITDSIFDNAGAPALYAILTDTLEFSGNTLIGNTADPVYTGCKNVSVE
ncbi:MAG: right-handed parallel beta-helix repeat-containing protein [Clostridia bacterium]|nr:right-handed parallel beta-helix repeat-containing protein [Clostridia bacterium]